MLAVASGEHATNVKRDKKVVSQIAPSRDCDFCDTTPLLGKRSSVVVAKNDENESRRQWLSKRLRSSLQCSLLIEFD